MIECSSKVHVPSLGGRGLTAQPFRTRWSGPPIRALRLDCWAVLARTCFQRLRKAKRLFPTSRSSAKLGCETVQRRLAELARQLGQVLIERHQSGYRLTAIGEAVLPHAESVASAAHSFEQHVRDGLRNSGGVLRLTCPESVAIRLAQSDVIGRFVARHADLTVEFVLSDRYVDLARGEVDVALRSGDTDDGVLVIPDDGYVALMMFTTSCV